MTVFLKIIYCRRYHNPPYPGTKLTFKLILSKIPEHFYEAFLQYIFRISNGFGIAITYPQHDFCKKIIQLPLGSRQTFDTLFYQFIIIHLLPVLTTALMATLH